MTAAPPPPTRQATRRSRAHDDRWQERLLRSRFLLVALAIHAVAFVMAGTIVIVQPILEDEPILIVDTFAKEDEGQSSRSRSVEVPPPSVDDSGEVGNLEIPVPSSLLGGADYITTSSTQTSGITAPNLGGITVPVPGITGQSGTVGTPEPNAPRPTGERRDYGKVKDTVGDWRPKNDLGRPRSQITAEFKAYLAKYRGGDWASTISMQDGKIVNGSLLNLMAYTTQWTKGRIKATLMPEPLDLGSAELLEVMPPFVLMTGRKDFTLTDAEVVNLQKYLIAGGCIWGDSGLAGKGSRFDVAFKREMKRVLQDVDLKWENLPNSHAIYTDSQYKLRGPAPGMNYYDEPLQAILLDGELAVLYTPNDYADMMRLVFKHGVTPLEVQRPGRNVTRATPNQLWQHRGPFFRNFDVESSEHCYKMGINIIVHLLTRFDERLLLGAP